MNPLRRLILAAVLVALALFGPAARAQAPADPLQARVFPPDLILHHADAIDLSADQRRRIVAEVAALRRFAQEIGQRGERARSALIAAVDARPTDEARVLVALDAVLAVERDIKRRHLATLIRLRSVLTQAQQARLQALRSAP